MKRILLPVVALTLSLSAVSTAGAATGTFGADLNHLPPNNTPGDVCSAGIPSYGLPAGSQSCMFTYFGSGADTLFAPVSGTVTAVRVRMGNVTGKMRVNVVRFNYYQTGDPTHPKTVTGPFLEAYGPEFTPQANAVTQVATSLPVRLDPNPAPGDTSTIHSSDALALEVEAPNVPIPFASDAAASSLYATYPGPTEQGLGAPSFNSIPGTRQIAGGNLGLLMNADLTTGSPTSPPPPPVNSPRPPVNSPRPPANSPPAVRLFGGPVRVRHGAAAIPLRCLDATCAGRISLGNRTKRYGSASFSLRSGRSTRVKIWLTAAGRALLKHHARVTVLAKVSFNGGRGRPSSFRVTLER